MSSFGFPTEIQTPSGVEATAFGSVPARKPDPSDDPVRCRVDPDGMVVLEGPDAVHAGGHTEEEVGRRSEVDPRDNCVRVRIDAVDGVDAVGCDPDASGARTDAVRARDAADSYRLRRSGSDHGHGAGVLVCDPQRAVPERRVEWIEPDPDRLGDAALCEVDTRDRVGEPIDHPE